MTIVLIIAVVVCIAGDLVIVRKIIRVQEVRK